MNKIILTIIGIILLPQANAKEALFTHQTTNNYCNKKFYFVGKTIKVYAEANNTSKLIKEIKTKPDEEFTFKPTESFLVTVAKGNGTFIKEPENIVTIFHGSVSLINSSNRNKGLSYNESNKLKPGTNFDYLMHAEEEFAYIRVGKMVYLTDITPARITKKPIVEWWVKPSLITSGWVRLTNTNYRNSKCNW